MTLTLNAKTEAACAGLINISGSLPVSWSVYTGIDTEDKAAPAVICYCRECQQDTYHVAIAHCKTDIIVKQIAFDSGNVISGSYDVSDTFEIFFRDSSANDLTNCVSDYYVYDIILENQSEESIGDAWTNTLHLDIISMHT